MNIIERNRSVRRIFDPAVKADREDFKYFLINGKWKNNICPFLLDWPYLTVPDMIKDRITRHTLHI